MRRPVRQSWDADDVPTRIWVTLDQRATVWGFELPLDLPAAASVRGFSFYFLPRYCSFQPSPAQFLLLISLLNYN